MKSVFIIKNRDNTPFMVVSTTPEGTKFQPMTESAKEIAVFLRQEYSKTKITRAELEQTMDSSKIIEGPSPDSSVTSKKVALLNSEPQYSQELVTLPVLSISEVLLSEFSNAEYRNVLTFKAASFISDQTRSSANFEVKAVRAVWDPSLSIPGTNRRGGFRCPVGTRYGGQITDRFGRSCGWGVARRIANQIADIGERLEQRDDDKRKRRLDRRNARMIARLQGGQRTGRIEGGLRDIAQRLDGDGGAPRAPRPRREIDTVREANRQEALAELRRVRDEVIMPRVPRRRGRQVPRDEEAETPSARPPRNRRRDVIPETAPTPKPKPKPAQKPAPQGRRRPQPRPRVAPQSENVDVLTAREASDAGESEAFQPYVLRKYNEYAQRVREIREGGGNAGMLTRREWYAINKDNLRDAWKDVHGRSAPQDFEPPAPRRPQNNRRRRRAATAVPAGRSASRKPTPDDVPEPAPAKPVRPSPRKTPRPPVKASTVDKNAPTRNFDHSGVAYRDFASAQNKARQLASRENQDFHVVNYAGNGFGDGADKYYVLDNDQYEALRANEALNAPDAEGVIGWREEALVPAPNRFQPPPPITPPSAVGPTNLPPAPSPQAPPTPPRTPRGGQSKVSPLNRARDRHETGLPKLANGKYDEIPVGNKNIRTKAQALAYTGPISDIPDKFLESVLTKRSDFVKDKQANGIQDSGLAKAMFGENGARTPEQIRELRDILLRIKKARTTSGQLTDGDKEALKKLKASGVDYISFYAGTGGSNPSFHLFIGNDGNIDGRGYLLKPKDRAFGNGANHSELLGAILAEQMGFAHGQGRVITTGASSKALLELGPNFADGQADNVGNIMNGSASIMDKESRLGASLINGILGAHDRHAGNGMVFDGNGALPIDFGRAFYHRNDTASQLFQYMTRGDYRGIDTNPFAGYKTKYQAELRAGKTPQQAKDALRGELKQTVEQWRDGIKQVIDNGVVDNLNARFANMTDVGAATVGISNRKATINNRINIMTSDEFLDLMITEISS